MKCDCPFKAKGKKCSTELFEQKSNGQDELKPCPFCGKKANLGHWSKDKNYDEYYLIIYTFYFTRTIKETLKKAVIT